MNYYHVPVMLKEVLNYLNPRIGQHFIDCTLGGGGYTLAIAEKVGKQGRVLAIDLDELALENIKEKIKKHKNKNIILVHENFKNLSKIVNKIFKKVRSNKLDGIVFDLGLSSAQLQDRHRGFSFKLDAPLDMRFAHKHENNEKEQKNTKYIINSYQQEELEKILREYGEERFAGRIARGIVEQRKLRPIKTTGQLVEIVKNVVPKKYLYSRIHPATRTFQALRIATNGELENLKEALPQAVNSLKSGGRIVVVSYHSLEDRIVKHFFKKEAKEGKIKILTKKIVRPSEEEIEDNPRSRSAKMRVSEKI